MTVFVRIEKDPDAIRTYTIDWANGGDNDGSIYDKGWLQSDTIATSTWILSSTDITNVAEANDTTTASIKISGGILGKIYKVTNRIVTANGETDDRTIQIKIVQK